MIQKFGRAIVTSKSYNSLISSFNCVSYFILYDNINRFLYLMLNTNSWRKRSAACCRSVLRMRTKEKLYMVLITTFTECKVSLRCQPHIHTQRQIDTRTHARKPTYNISMAKYRQWNHVYLQHFGKQFSSICIYCIESHWEK